MIVEENFEMMNAQAAQLADAELGRLVPQDVS